MKSLFTKLTRILTATVFTAFIFISPKINVFAQSSEQITNYNVNYYIQESGVVNVEESIDYYFSEPRHGIFRFIPYQKKNDKGSTFILDIKDVQVSLDNNPNVPYTVTKKGGNYEVKIGDKNVEIVGNHRYVIKYNLHGALTYFDDHDEFYWNVNGNEWEIPIFDLSATVTFEPFMEERDLEVICYSGYINSTNQDCRSLITKTPSVTTQADTILSPGEGLTVAVSFPKGKVAQLEPKRDIIGTIIMIVLVALAVGWYLLVPIYVFSIYLKQRNNVKRKQRILPAWFSPPKDDAGNTLSPAETGYIYSKNIDNKYITATIVQLAQKGLLKIRVNSKKDITFIKTEATAPTSPFEDDIMSGLFSGTSGVESRLSDLKKSTSLATQVSNFKTHVSSSIKKLKLFKYDPSTYSGIIIAIGLIALFFTANILLGLVCLLFLRKAVPHTDLGIDKYSEAASLRNFLVSQNDQLDFQAENQMYFEKLLPYATAFGVEDVWIKRFGNLDIKMPEWYEGDAVNFYALSSINNSIARTVSSSVNHSASRSSSGFSSGFSGGSSGGGGGGGGGGSW